MAGRGVSRVPTRGTRPAVLKQFPKYGRLPEITAFIGREVLWNVPLTPVEERAAPTIDRLPGDISAQLKREFWRRHGDLADFDYSLTWQTAHAARDWLAAEVKEFEREKIHRAFDEEEIRALANRWSDLCMRMVRLEPMQDFARSVGIEPPEVKKTVTRVGAARRLACPRWWRRQIRKHYLRRAETHLRARGFVHRRRQVYASDRAVENRRQRKTRDKELLQELQAVSSDGDQLELWDVVQKSQANPALRRAELMTRLQGFEEVAQAAGHVAEFVTLTCPSAFHCMHDNGSANERWQGFSPRDGQQWLCKMWARSRSKLKRIKVKFYGVRIAEPHHDGTPHWHAVLFVARHQVDALRAVIAGIWLAEYADEPGARKYRSKFVRIDPAKGSACGYVAKYVSKNIDGFQVGEDYETQKQDAADSCERVAAWASAHGVRQFQQIGGPPVTVWRELRRLRSVVRESAAIEAAREAADAGEWSAFIAALGGVDCGRDVSVRLWTEVTGEISQYDELKAKQIAGVQCVSSQSNARWVGAMACSSASSCDGTPVLTLGSRSVVLNVELRSDYVMTERVRTRTKCWRIQRKAGRALAPDSNGKIGTGACEARAGSASFPSSLGPVSITVRASQSVPSRIVDGEHASPSNRGPAWMN